MGLDIYLYTREQVHANQLSNAALEAFYSRADYDSLSTEERKALGDALPEYSLAVDVPSEKYPDHLFNRRYLRSSYNSGGFNCAVPNLTGKDHDLYWIFEPLDRQWDGDERILTDEDIPALQEASTRAKQVALELTVCDPIRVMSETPIFGDREHLWSELPSEDEVLDWYREEKVRHIDKVDGSYLTAKGAIFGFAGGGLEVLAVTLGRDSLGRPAAMLIYRQDPQSLRSYIQSAEIIVEFCDEAISLIERDGSVQMSWSG